MKTRHLFTDWKSILAAAALLLPFGASAGFAPYPFSEGFETWINTNYWTLQGTWGPTWAVAHTGNNSLASNPWNPTYAPNEDSSAIVGVSLLGATRPVLTFWQLYSLDPGEDYGFVEVSRDQGVTWTSLGAVTGLNSTNWQRTQDRPELGCRRGGLNPVAAL